MWSERLSDWIVCHCQDWTKSLTDQTKHMLLIIQFITLHDCLENNITPCFIDISFSIVENIRVKQRPLLFCKYLHNDSLDLNKILYGGQLLSC